VFLLDPLTKLHWQHYRRAPNQRLSHQWRGWLLDRGSLTQRLITLSGNHFRVQVLRHFMTTPVTSERIALSLLPRQTCLIREVALLCHHQPMVFARSVIPITTLKGPEKQLTRLGNKPLGALLFQHRNMTRGPLELAQFHHLFSDHPCAGWGRRSVFYLNSRPLLVSEFFLPDLL